MQLLRSEQYHLEERLKYLYSYSLLFAANTLHIDEVDLQSEKCTTRPEAKDGITWEQPWLAVMKVITNGLYSSTISPQRYMLQHTDVS